MGNPEIIDVIVDSSRSNVSLKRISVETITHNTAAAILCEDEEFP